MKLEIQINESLVKHIKEYPIMDMYNYDNPSEIDLNDIISIFLEDLKDCYTRPGSWEAGKIFNWMEGHGFTIKED